MLRITEIRQNGNVLRLRLDGTITSAAFEDIAQACSKREDERQIVILDMAGVNFMDDDSTHKLARLRGVRLVNCSPFIAALLDTVERPR